MKIIILDRDGVINEDSDSYIKSPDEWIPIPGSLEGIARLCHGGYRVVVASNQSGLARGLFTIDDLNAMHRKMHRELARVGGQVDSTFFCPHGPDDDCRCRKPRPGLFEQIAYRLRKDLTFTPAVGDSCRDIEAALAVGATPILVLTGNGRATLRALPRALMQRIQVFKNLSAVADSLVAV
jgi:D-glycero-D-manno-heptose 1,7-bisphosphate phosphatase